MSVFFKTAAALVLAAVITATGCSPTEKDEQPPGTFYFPTSIAVHPSQRYAYVVSSNFDLGYKHGTIKVIDLGELDREILADASGTGCGGTTCAQTRFSGAIVEDSTVRIGNFAGTAVFNPAASRLFVSQRQDGAVAWLNVSEGGARLDCRGSTADTPEAQPSEFVGDCHKGHLISSGSDDPFTLAYGPNPVTPDAGCVYVAHLKFGVVSCIEAESADPSAAGPVFSADFSRGQSPSGISDIAITASGRLFATNRFLVEGANVLGAGDPASLATSGTAGWLFDIGYVAGGGEQKSMVMTPDGGTLFLLTRAPDALIRMSVGSDSAGTPYVEAMDYVPAGIWPERLFMWENDLPARRLLYVACTDNDYIHVFDAETLYEIALLRDGFDGPYWMAFYDTGAGKRALVANFENSTVAVVSIDPATMAHQTLAVIGNPRVKAKGEY
ncbi:MAG: hypothetical protein HY897_18035 [Deltaproteobacteria bacterium]|nr:hypothetical protein [Deltaproteobacteria bacterium]